MCFFLLLLCELLQPRESWTEVETENGEGGGEGRRQWEKPPAINPLRFLKLRSLFGRRERQSCRQNTNFKRVPSVEMWLTWFMFAQKKYSTSVFETSRKSSEVLKLQRIILKSKRGAVSERKIFLKKEKTYVAHLLAKTTHCVAWYHEKFVFAQPDSSQEFSDAKKFYASKTPNNLKRVILKRKRAVSEWEIFWKRRKKNTLHIYYSENWPD